MMNEFICIKDNIKKVENGVESMVLSLQCNIETGKSVNFSSEVYDQQTYNENLDIILTRIEKFKAHCRERAKMLDCEVFVC